MEKGEFEESKTFNLTDILEFNSNSIVVKNISVQNSCIIQAFAFDFGKVLSHNESPFVRFIHIIEGRAEVVINGNSTFMRRGDSIIIPASTPCSFEANHKFKMLCATIKNEWRIDFIYTKAYPMKKNYIAKRYKKGDLVYAKVRPSVILVVRLYVRKVYYCMIQNNTCANEMVYLDSELRPYLGNLSTVKQGRWQYEGGSIGLLWKQIWDLAPQKNHLLKMVFICSWIMGS